MPHSDPLVPFGIAIIIIVGLFIAIPFLRRKSDLLTSWNTLLLGFIIFAGLGSIEVNRVPYFSFEQLELVSTFREGSALVHDGRNGIHRDSTGLLLL